MADQPTRCGGYPTGAGGVKSHHFGRQGDAFGGDVPIEAEMAAFHALPPLPPDDAGADEHGVFQRHPGGDGADDMAELPIILVHDEQNVYVRVKGTVPLRPFGPIARRLFPCLSHLLPLDELAQMKYTSKASFRQGEGIAD